MQVRYQLTETGVRHALGRWELWVFVGLGAEAEDVGHGHATRWAVVVGHLERAMCGLGVVEVELLSGYG